MMITSNNDSELHKHKKNIYLTMKMTKCFSFYSLPIIPIAITTSVGK